MRCLLRGEAYGSVPVGWLTETGGWPYIGVANARAYEGTNSVLTIGRPYQGVGISADSTPDLTTGKYKASYYMFVDTSIWTADGGEAKIGFVFPNGKGAWFGAANVEGVWKIEVYDGSNYPAFLESPINILDSWVEYTMTIDFDTETTEYFVNGNKVGNGTLLSNRVTPRIYINSNVLYASGGQTAAYFDSVRVETLVGGGGVTPVGYTPTWLIITLLSLTVAGGYILRRKTARQ